MRRVIYSLNVSLDGFVEGPTRNLDWVIMDEQLHRFFNDHERELGALLYGRRMYEGMNAYWPTVDANPSAPAYIVEYAQIWQSTPKIVFSQTLNKVEGNSRLVRDDVAAEVARLKAQPGQDLGVGGATLAATLIRHGLVDEYQAVVHPVVLGSGTPFFPALDNPINLRLVETRTFGSGVVYLRYYCANEEH